MPQDLDQALTEPAIQKEIIGGIDSLCSDLGPLSGVCKTLIQHYAPELLGYLAKELDPTTICADIHVCAQ